MLSMALAAALSDLTAACRKVEDLTDDERLRRECEELRLDIRDRVLTK